MMLIKGIRHDEFFEMRQEHWEMLLLVAEAYGWKPIGTVPPEELADKIWDGNYMGGYGHYVTHEDAVNIAKALKKVSKKEFPKRISCLDFSHYIDFFEKGEFSIS